jgi:hypothetical protein
MQFQIPQFIEVEDKIFGPLTLKQFFYLIGGAAAIFLLYVALPLFLVILLAPPVGAFAAALAFFKVNNQPFMKVVENAFRHFTKARVYTWKKREIKRKKIKKEEGPQKEQVYVPKLTTSKLSNLSWSLEIKEDSERGTN